MTKTETMRAPIRVPKVIVSWEEAPVNSVEPVGAAVPFVGTMVANVVAAGGAGASLVMMPAGTATGAGVPTTRAADEDPAGVSKTT